MRFFAVFICVASALCAQTASKPEGPLLVDGLEVQKLMRLELHAGDGLLETVQAVIDKKNVRDGVVLTAVGNLERCRFHAIEGKIHEVEGKLALISLAGTIIAGKPHLHITFAGPDNRVVGGHLETGCRVLTRVELVLASTGKGSGAEALANLR